MLQLQQHIGSLTTQAAPVLDLHVPQHRLPDTQHSLPDTQHQLVHHGATQHGNGLHAMS